MKNPFPTYSGLVEAGLPAAFVASCAWLPVVTGDLVYRMTHDAALGALWGALAIFVSAGLLFVQAISMETP